MSKAMTNDALLRSVGNPIEDKAHETIGEIVEVRRNPDHNYIEYIIIETKLPDDAYSRFFAIPVSSRFIEITDTDTVILKLPVSGIRSAKSVSADKCPRPNLKFGNSIFRLDNYQKPKKSKIIA